MIRKDRGTRGTASIAAGAALVAAALALLMATTGSTSLRGGFTGSARVAAVNKTAELIKVLPVGKSAGDKKQVVMSMPAWKLGDLQNGDRLEATTEFEVTICLKPDPGWPGFPCVGTVYGYSPTIAAQIVIGPSP